MGMGIVTYELKVFELEVEERLDIGVKLHLWQWSRLSCQLELGLFDMVQVEVGVARRVDEVPGLESRYLCHHLEQEGVRGDVEGYAEESVSRALVDLQRETVIGHIELEDGVAWGQCHLIHLGHIPCRDNHTTGVRIVLQLIQHILYLVDSPPVIIGP